MKKLIWIVTIILTFTLCSCAPQADSAQIVATTLPVYEFTVRLCEGTGLTVSRLITENVSCLHDYSLNVNQVKAAEAAQTLILSGAGLEDFMEDVLSAQKTRIDSSKNIAIIHCENAHAHDHDHNHDHEHDPHIWLSPANAKLMAANICAGLSAQYPHHAETFSGNLQTLLSELDALQSYGEAELADLSTRNLITFHDGFAYFAQAFGLTILEAVEEESGSEASAAELVALINVVKDHQLPAIFTETNGSSSAAQIIARETGAKVYTLDMVMSGDSYFDAMYRNIDTIKEALQ